MEKKEDIMMEPCKLLEYGFVFSSNVQSGNDKKITKNTCKIESEGKISQADAKTCLKLIFFYHTSVFSSTFHDRKSVITLKNNVQMMQRYVLLANGRLTSNVTVLLTN